MKLYTEEQILNSMKSVKYYIEHYNENVIDSIIDKHLKALQPIELPSDEEIEEGLFHQSNEYSYGYKDAFNFMRNKILNQKKLMDERNDYNSIPMQHTQTAVEWLEKEINKRGPKENNPPQWLKELYEQAKQMEKEQKQKEWEKGWNEATSQGIKETHKYQ